MYVEVPSSTSGQECNTMLLLCQGSPNLKLFFYQNPFVTITPAYLNVQSLRLSQTDGSGSITNTHREFIFIHSLGSIFADTQRTKVSDSSSPALVQSFLSINKLALSVMR